MAEINRVTLFGKLNQPTYKAVEGATVFCKLRGNPYVELEHWLASCCSRQTPTGTESSSTASSTCRRWPRT